MTFADPDFNVAAVVETVRREGLCVIRGAFNTSAVDNARRVVLANLALMRNTRPTPSSRHLAGFHRYSQLEHLHVLLTGHPVILSCIERLCGDGARTIGLSDITVNRSQSWHKDLLRGQYSEYITDLDVCKKWNGTVFKLLFYLQASNSLQYVGRSHKADVVLTSDDHSVPDAGAEVRRVEVDSGDVVVMDVCTTHRGTDESAFQSPGAAKNPRILISTVFGAKESKLTDQLELGNAFRLADWMRRHA